MATSLNELEKMDRIDNIHTNTFHLVKKIVKIGPVYPEIALLNLKQEGLAVARIARDDGSSSTNRSSDGYD